VSALGQKGSPLNFPFVSDRHKGVGESGYAVEIAMTTIVHYESGDGSVEELEPDEYHAESDPLMTLLWEGTGVGYVMKQQIPLCRVVRVVEHPEQ